MTRRSFRPPVPLTSLALTAALLLGGCKEEPTAGVQRLEGVPGTDPAATVAPSATASGTQGTASPHGSDPHAGLMPSHAGASDTTAPAGTAAGGAMPFAPPAGVEVRAGGNILEAAGVAFTVPEGWKQVPPSNPMRLAQYALPGAAGEGELVLFYFGRGQGGDRESNIRRWAAQFRNDDPSTTTLGADVGELEKDGLRVALVKTSGTYDPGSMGMGPAPEPKPDWALFGLVIEGGPEGSIFVKATGPKATMEAHNANLEAFAQSVRRSSYK